MSGQHLGAQDVLFGKLGPTLQTLYPQAQVIELPTGAVQQTQRQPRGQNPVFHDFIAHQLKLAAVQRQAHRDGGGGRQGFFPGGCGGLNPDGLVALKGNRGIAAVLHFARVTTLAHQPREFLLDALSQLRQHPRRMADKLFACPPGKQKFLLGIGGHKLKV